MTIDNTQIRSEGVGDKLVNLAELAVAYDALNEAKSNKISSLSSVANDPISTDYFVLDRSGTEYKLDYGTMSSAITGILGGDPVTIAHGGTGASTASSALTNLGAVSKSGDTMTGNLIVSSGRITSGTTSGATESQIVNASSAGRIYLYSEGTSTGIRGIGSYNASGVSKGILSIDKDNNITFSGGTYSGQALFSTGGVKLRFPSSVDITQADNGVSAATWGLGAFSIGDANDKNVGLMNSTVYPDGSVRMSLRVNNYNSSGTRVTDGGIDIHGDKSGNITYTVSNASNFRSAIGAGTSSSDTKNTAGSTDTSDKIFIIGAKSQSANPQTYSQDTAYVGTDGFLYSDGRRTISSLGSLTAAGSMNSTTMGIGYANGATDGGETEYYGALLNMCNASKNATRIGQLFIGASSANADMKVRTYNGQWNAWKTVYTSATTVPVANGGTGSTGISATAITFSNADSRFIANSSSGYFYRWGKVVFVMCDLFFNCGTTAFAANSDIDVTLSNIPAPKHKATSVSYNSGNIIASMLNTSKLLRYRNTSGGNITKASLELVVSYTYLAE